MKWEYIRADQYCDSVRDGTHDTPKPTESGYRLVTGKHIKNGEIDISNTYYISEKDYNAINNRSLVEQWDVLMSMIGTVGETAVVKEKPNYAIKNIALFKCGGSKLKGYWLYYYLSSPLCQGYMNGSQKGSSQQFLSLNQLRSLPILITEEAYMRNVVNILSAYDDLIENNQKQIKLLEEAAQRLYKEWFVDLRFPGYETTPISGGIPQGWAVGVLDDIAFESGKNESKVNREKYMYYLPIDCLPKKSLGYTESADISMAESSLVGFHKNDIIFGAMRPYFHKVVIARDKGLTRSTCFVLNARETEMWAYLAMVMFSKDTIDHATQISVGATMPYVRWKDLKQMPLLIPTKDSATKFSLVISPIINKIAVLCNENICLKQARDRLLPKLMNGEIEV